MNKIIMKSLDSETFDPASTRELYLGEEVTNDSVLTIIKKINAINEWYEKEISLIKSILSEISIESESEVILKLPETEPINLNIVSYGGSIYDGLALVNVMENSLVPVNTTVVGQAMSMGMIIALVGDKRFGYKKSTWMYHEGSGLNIGKISNQQERLDELNRLQSILDDIVIDNSDITKDQLMEIRKHKKNWYINGEEALKYLITDELIDGDNEEIEE